MILVQQLRDKQSLYKIVIYTKLIFRYILRNYVQNKNNTPINIVNRFLSHRTAVRNAVDSNSLWTWCFIHKSNINILFFLPQFCDYQRYDRIISIVNILYHFKKMVLTQENTGDLYNLNLKKMLLLLVSL